MNRIKKYDGGAVVTYVETSEPRYVSTLPAGCAAYVQDVQTRQVTLPRPPYDALAALLPLWAPWPPRGAS